MTSTDPKKSSADADKTDDKAKPSTSSSSSKSKNKASAKKDKLVLRSAEHWARELGKVTRVRDVAGEQLDNFDADHRAATKLHGWDAHQAHTGQPFVMDREVYEAACKATHRPVLCTDGQHHYVPHGPALSEHASEQAKSFKPASED